LSVELHLPDLPEVAVAIGAESGAPGISRRTGSRWRSSLATALPLMLMAMLALATWWLVKNSPQAGTPSVAGPLRHVADYRVERFTLQRFDASGQLVMQIEGANLRHFPDTDEFEVDTAHLHATGLDGRDTVATARQAIAAGNGSQVRLVGGAHVVSRAGQGEATEVLGEQLLALIDERRVLAEQPVLVRQGASEYTAAGMTFDEKTRFVTLTGPARAVLHPHRNRP
jgi:lipopolysaccharide export system protein LptC